MKSGTVALSAMAVESHVTHEMSPATPNERRPGLPSGVLRPGSWVRRRRRKTPKASIVMMMNMLWARAYASGMSAAARKTASSVDHSQVAIRFHGCLSLTQLRHGIPTSVHTISRSADHDCAGKAVASQLCSRGTSGRMPPTGVYRMISPRPME